MLEPSAVLQLPHAQRDRTGARKAHHAAQALEGLLNVEGLAVLGQAHDGLVQTAPRGARLACPEVGVPREHPDDVRQGGP
ncbi:MAG TPA: hypothetical protein VKL22_06045 [Actinomycetota bacterium]|nr:hypothetical protein [Actinomycetota bacterium]